MFSLVLDLNKPLGLKIGNKDVVFQVFIWTLTIELKLELVLLQLDSVVWLIGIVMFDLAPDVALDNHPLDFETTFLQRNLRIFRIGGD